MADTFYNAIKQDLIMIKNDTMQFGFCIEGLNGVTPEQITFTVKDNPDNNEYIFKKDLNKGIALREYDEANDVFIYGVRIAPDDTKTVNAGRYFYDLQVNVNEDILTLLKGRLTIEYEVTSGQAPEPGPDYENGDEVQYPIENIPTGTIKLYTEQYINNLIAKIQEIENTPDHFTVETADAAINNIQTEIVNINGAINNITGGSVTIPLSDMAAAIGNLPQNGIKAFEFDLTFSTYTTT